VCGLSRLAAVQHKTKSKRAKKGYEFPRIRELPERERGPFLLWLRGQTCPFEPKVALADQDFYFAWDYDRWRKTRRGVRVLWD